MRKVILAIIGGIAGLPLSYFFQPSIVKKKSGGIGGYMNKFGDIMEYEDYVSNVLVSVVVFALIGFVIGYYMDKNASR